MARSAPEESTTVTDGSDRAQVSALSPAATEGSWERAELTLSIPVTAHSQNITYSAAHLDTSPPHSFPSPPQLGPDPSELWENKELSLSTAQVHPTQKARPKGDVALSPGASSQLCPELTGELGALCQA